MHFSLHRIPRESKVAAVVLAAALVQLCVLGALGLRNTAERRKEREDELRDRARRVVAAVVADVDRRIGDQERKLAAELGKDDGRSAFQRVRDAMDRGIAPVFARAYLVDSEGRLTDSDRPPYPVPASREDPSARARVAKLLDLERSDPAAAIQQASDLANDLMAHSGDAVAAARALQSGCRAAYATKDLERARSFAKTILEKYRALSDDGGAFAMTEPFGPAASAVLCDVLRHSLGSMTNQAEFVDEVVARRVQAQRLRPILSQAAFLEEVDQCEALRRDTSTLLTRSRDELAKRLEECRSLDQALERVRSVPQRALREAALAKEPRRFDVDATDARALLTVLPLRAASAPAAGEPVAAALVATIPAIKAEALEPATRAVDLLAGLAFVARDAWNHDFLTSAQGQPLLDPVPFGGAVPGLFANIVLVDSTLLDQEAASDRRLWLAILAGAGLAVVAASLLAVRAVLREVRIARMKSDFVSNLSHELRTPLTSLRMFVDTLREGRVRDEAEAKECLDVVAQETDRLQSLVERVLQFATFTRGRAPIELKSADAGEVARRAVQLFRKRAEAAHAALSIEVADPLPESILDRDAILQVFLNLLDNAVKYAGHDGAKIHVSVRSHGTNRVAIAVEDDGPGVPERERELVFEEFYRGDDTLSRRVEGTGIGLAVSRRIVLAHGGRIEVSRSERLSGARFTVTLPEATVGRRLALESASAGGRS